MKLFFALSAVGAALWLAGGCSPAPPVKKSAPVPVLTANVIVTNLPELIDPPPVGHVTPISTVTIRSQIGGIISRVCFQEGQAVKAGELLFTIDSRPMQAALVQAQADLQRDTAQLENAQIQFAREQKLLDQKLVSQDEYDTSKAGFDALAGTVAADHAAVTNAELNLEYTSIRSPLDGQTGSLQFHEGNVVKAPDDVLLTINQIHPIYVAFAVPEAYLPEIKKSQRRQPLTVTATFDHQTGPAPMGELTFIDNAVDPTTGTILLKATFPNADGSLWPGQFVQVLLKLSELTQILAVPSQAVQTGQNGQFVYVVKSDQTVEERAVVAGITYQGWTVVAKGLADGEMVVTDGQLRLAPGVAVKVKNEGKKPHEE